MVKSTGSIMSNGKIVKPPNLGYYCGAKFDTIPTLSILPPLPNHWRSSESKSTPSSPVPLSFIDTNMTPSGSSTTSGRSTVPVLKATSLPTAAGHDHDIKTAFANMKTVKVRDNNRAESDPETKGQIIYDAKGLPQKGKRRGRVHKKEQKQTTPAPPVHSEKGKSASNDTNTNKKAQAVNSSQGGYILMAMLQSGKGKTGAVETEHVPHLVQSHNAQSLKIKSAESLTKSNTTSTQSQYQLYGSCRQEQFEQQNEDSSKLKALLKVCT